MKSAAPNLKQVQWWMKTKIDLVPDKSAGEGVLVPLNLQRGEPGENRLAVYADGYLARTREALEGTYETIRSLIGCEEFSELTQEHAAKFPSREYNLNYYGRHLPEFLSEHPLTKKFPFLVDLANLEWQLSESFHATHRAPFDRERLAAIPPEKLESLRLYFQPSVAILATEWPLYDLWKARREPKKLRKTKWREKPQKLLVGRYEYQIFIELVPPLEYEILKGLLAGKTLGSLFEELAEKMGNTPPPLKKWFSRWSSLGLISDFSVAE